MKGKLRREIIEKMQQRKLRAITLTLQGLIDTSLIGYRNIGKFKKIAL